MDKKLLPLNPKTELLKWGPLPGRYYFVSDFDAIYTVFPKKYPGEYWSRALIIFKGKTLIWINEFPEARKCGKSVFLKFMVPETKQKKVIKKWRNNLKILNKVEERIKKTNLSKLSSGQFVDLWKESENALMGFWEDVVIPELANYGSDKILELSLKKYIKNKTEINSAMEILTAPENLSFYKKEEMDLLKAKDIKKHAKKYFWIQNSYAGTKIADLDFFKKRKKYLPPNLEIELKRIRNKTQEKKQELAKKYNLPENILRISNAIVDGIEWQDERKGHVFIYLHYKNLLIEEAARKLSVSKDDLLNFGTKEILEFLKKKSADEVKNRRNSFAIVMDKKRIEYLDSKIAKRFWNIYVEEKVSGNIKEFRGITVSKGKSLVNGKVKIVLDPLKVSSFKQGNILVAPMTTPDYIFLMKKASAVITDTGGLTSHAAIVSRELGIPCIVGTKIATRVLKDDQLVEVNANQGIVKIIS
ncbi:MAG: PEP-utilizing enzyme [Patescibacteria group bacterium]